MATPPLLINAPQQKLPDTVQAMIADPRQAGVRFYPFAEPSMTGVYVNAGLVGVPAAAVLIALLVPVVRSPLAIGPLLCISLAVVICFWVIVGQLNRIRHALRRQRLRRAQPRQLGVYLGADFVLFLLSARRAHLIPREAINGVREARVCFQTRQESYVEDMMSWTIGDIPILVGNLPVVGGFSIESLNRLWAIPQNPGRLDVSDDKRRQMLMIGGG